MISFGKKSHNPVPSYPTHFQIGNYRKHYGDSFKESSFEYNIRYFVPPQFSRPKSGLVYRLIGIHFSVYSALLVIPCACFRSHPLFRSVCSEITETSKPYQVSLAFHSQLALPIPAVVVMSNRLLTGGPYST